jgi:hypothetical protein
MRRMQINHEGHEGHEGKTDRRIGSMREPYGGSRFDQRVGACFVFFVSFVVDASPVSH